MTLVEIGAQDDPLAATGGNDRIVGLLGDDDIVALAGNDMVYGGAGFDLASSMASAAGDLLAQIEGLSGANLNDILTGNSAVNQLFGIGRVDSVNEKAGLDRIYGGAGNDAISGDDGNDWLFGDAVKDRVWGGNGNDILRGGSGNDALLSGSGNDQILGDAGADDLTGGADDVTIDGADVFHFVPGLGSDQIDHFSIAQDRLEFSGIAEISSLANFNPAAVSFGGNTLVSFSDGSTIFRTGVLEAQFTNANFIF